MKKSVAVLITLFLVLPASVQAQGLQEKFNIAHIGHSEIIKNGNIFSTIVDLTMRDGKEFLITVTFDKKTLTATFSFASGKTVVITPAGMEI